MSNSKEFGLQWRFHAGFDIPFPELGNDSAVVLHVYAVKRKDGAHRVENRIVSRFAALR